jgi:hypothetical protein
MYVAVVGALLLVAVQDRDTEQRPADAQLGAGIVNIVV